MDLTRESSQSVITCRNSQGTELTANLLRIKRYSVVFEVYNPYSILQLSEVLSDFRIMASRRLLYHGKAVVSNLLNTGIVLVCEAMLDEGWVEVDVLSSVAGSHSSKSDKPDDLASQFASFMGEWKSANKVQNPFKLVVSDMGSMLSGVQHWLTGVDVGIRTTVTRRRDELENEIFSSIQQRVVEEVLPAMQRFEEVVNEVEEGEVAVHKSYARRELHPIMLCSPFLYRTYTKPLGYAGDYEMVNMMLRNPYEGSSAFAKLLNFALLNTAPVVAHRNRIDYLVTKLSSECARRVSKGKTRVFNLACGPAVEIQRFLRDFEESELAEIDLLDFNAETLDYTRERIQEARMSGGRQTPVRYFQRSVHQLLRAATQGGEDEFTGYDIVYCAGLFDYLSQRVCKRLVELFCTMVKPGGLVIVTNVSDSNPSKAWMEYLVEWNLIYRGRPEMDDLVPDTVPVKSTNILEDETGVNLFLEIELSNG
ncbi:class I SAM-dependent methyltransferase [Luteolibacter pohnpeiensis]|uniref:Class I SAM-dependent methyltransferase n=1 Tax=Luteolibacter pohnpeiensis TaxID=454153 RepID=A0A934S363_9BACT|nr:class I SAM-dependent methyltransferase [Luteolibacter pohnpeiensis]MBK1881053.1 class I SAM-dependent methyltransferase [Luteolibacter pohnpeiensis]